MAPSTDCAAATQAYALDAHPPERGRRQEAVALASGCCCCCCCLHTAGSLIGAAASSGRWYNWDKDEKEPSAGPIYWSVFAAAAVLSLLVALINHRDFAGYLVGIALLVPFGQLGVSLISSLIIVLGTKEEGKSARLRSLGRITAFSVTGGILGTVAMVAAAYAAPLFKW